MNPHSRQAGFSLVTALFLLVVVAGLMTYMISLSVVQHSTVVMSLQGARAMQAARAGLEYGIFQATQNDNCAANTLTFPTDGIALQSFSVAVTCTRSAHDEGTTAVNFFTLTATATSGTYALGANANPDFVSRRILATISDAPP